MTDDADVDEIYEIQAEMLKTLANARRLEIVHLLADGPRDVGLLARQLGMSQPNVSQHLGVMRAAGVVQADREGREVRYRLADPELVTACQIVRGVLARRVARVHALAEAPRIAVAEGR